MIYDKNLEEVFYPSDGARDKKINQKQLIATNFNKRYNSIDLPKIGEKKKLNRRGSVNDMLLMPTKHDIDSYLKDPSCDPDHPRTIEFQDILEAQDKIFDSVMRTPCKKSIFLSSMLDMEIYFKQEYLQATGSFKERGARHALTRLSPVQKKIGVIAASTGNHALGISYHGQLLNIPVTVVMPTKAPAIKISKCRKFGANVLVAGDDLGQSKEFALKMAAEHGYQYINGFDHPHILAGQGTTALEIIEQVENIDAVLIPIGGGGLLAGAGLAFKTLCPNVTIIGVESDKCPSFSRALEVGRPIRVQPGPTIADGLSPPMVGVNSFETVKINKIIDKIITVPDNLIAQAILHLLESEKAVVEGSGAVGLAALLGGYLPELKGKRVVVYLTGGNIDVTILSRSIENGLIEEGRLVRFGIDYNRSDDFTNQTTIIKNLLSEIDVIIKEMTYEYLPTKNNVRINVTAETQNNRHVKELESILNIHYENFIFNQLK